MNVIFHGGAQDGVSAILPESQVEVIESALDDRGYRRAMKELGFDVIDGVDIFSSLNPYSQELIDANSRVVGVYIKLGQVDEMGRELFVFTTPNLFGDKNEQKAKQKNETMKVNLLD